MPPLIKNQSWPLLASVGAIAVSPILQITSGQSMLYTMWLAVMMATMWVTQRLTLREVGVTLGNSTSYFIALAYPVALIGCVALGAWAAQLVDLKDYSATTVFRRVSLNFLLTFVLALITEEGFFRGALWGSCMRAGFSPAKTVVFTSLAFGVWHFAVPIIDPDFSQPLSKVPQYVIGSTAFGLAMGLLRLRSGSIVVPSLCHALWNASAYTFFGAGGKVGQLGVSDPTVWDPERGYAGLVLVVIGAAFLWLWLKPSNAPILARSA